MSILQTVLAKDILHNEVSHAYILTGEQRFAQALCFAMSLNCAERGEDGSPCGSCLSCRKAEDGNHPDIFILEPDRGNIRIEQTRKLIAALALEKFEGSYKVAIIKDCEQLRDESANNLLKTLEDPPDDTVFLLLTAQESKLLATVRSRCRIVHLHDENRIFADTEEQAVYFEAAETLLRELPGLPLYKVLAEAVEWEKDREAAIALCCALSELLMQALKSCFGGSGFTLAAQPAALLAAAEQSQTAAEQLRANVNTCAALDMLFLRLWSLLKPKQA